MMRTTAIAACLALLLTGCSGGTGTTPLYTQIGGAVRATIAARKAGRAPRAEVTRAQLDTLTDPFLEVTVERRDILAYLFISTIRRDDSPGEIVQWRSDDDATITMRNGVLIATRGLGGGVVSASARVEGDRPGPASGGARQLDIRAGDLDIRHVEFLCDLDDLGPERVVIVERAQATRHLRETCMAAGGGRVVNDYWIDSGGSDVVWQSRQWAGPEIGYIRTRRLTTG